jgi:hypothetical protein
VDDVPGQRLRQCTAPAVVDEPHPQVPVGHDGQLLVEAAEQAQRVRAGEHDGGPPMKFQDCSAAGSSSGSGGTLTPDQAQCWSSTSESQYEMTAPVPSDGGELMAQEVGRPDVVVVEERDPRRPRLGDRPVCAPRRRPATPRCAGP